MIALKRYNQLGKTWLIAANPTESFSQEKGPTYQFTRWLRLGQMVEYSTKTLFIQQGPLPKGQLSADFEDLNQDLPDVDFPMDDIVAELKAARRDRQPFSPRHF